MDTRLRSISTKTATKIIIFILFVIFITAAVVQMQYAVYRNINPESLFVKEYKDSEQFAYYANSALQDTIDIIVNENITLRNFGYIYHITNGENTYSNTQNADKSFFEQFNSAFYAYENGIWTFGENTSPPRITSFYKRHLSSYGLENDYTVYVAFPDEFMEEKQLEWQTSGAALVPIAIGTIACLVLSLLLIIFLIVVTGKTPQDRELHLSKLDDIYSDILLAAFIALAIVWTIVITNPFYGYGSYSSDKLGINQIYSMIFSGTVTAAVSVFCGVILLSLVRKIKAGKLLRHSLTFSVGFKTYDFCQSLFDGRLFTKQPLTKSLYNRQLIFIASSAVLVFFTFIFIFAATPLILLPPFLEILVIYWYIKGNNETFEKINRGFNESLEEQMRAERMKIALVTNVSHDLKTPLTSIISYVSLLSKEENLPETASDYVKILSEKANMLKQIVADLFDLAKSTSGNIALDLESLDIKKLIEQTLADMEDQIERAEIQIKTKLPDGPVNIFADGKKLYRVFQNVVDNALKYSLKGTRIFIELSEHNDKAIAIIKNTAGYEMDFTAEEILQRFNRGDKSRSTEGSGLGISIAESFTNVCGGAFNVDIDGDLFKVTISFNKA